MVGFQVTDFPISNNTQESELPLTLYLSYSLFRPFLSCLASAAVVSGAAITKKAACVYTCGSVCYWQSDIDAALAKGSSLQESGNDISTHINTPHRFLVQSTMF